jgi:hypothetical protein
MMHSQQNIKFIYMKICFNNVKVRLSLPIPWMHIGTAEVYLHSLFNLELDFFFNDSHPIVFWYNVTVKLFPSNTT